VSGFYYIPHTIPQVGDGHQALPAKGTWHREGTQFPADLLNPADYPVTAECMTCHELIRLAMFQQMEWTHAPVEGSKA
jgi:hypothetical protein